MTELNINNAYDPVCRCGAHCWSYEADKKEREKDPCQGEISVSEDYPGIYIHFCEHHGHPEDGR